MQLSGRGYSDGESLTERAMMQGLSQEEERFRVLLLGIEEDTEEKREAFCKNISKKYNLSFALLRGVVDRCPIVLRKNLSLRRAEVLAKTLKHFGALVSIEGRNDLPSIRLEFQELGAPVVSLEDSHLRRTQSETWSVTGKVKNISGADLNDLWVLVQLFGQDGTFLTFEEVPIPINPLPPQESSPFKVIFDGSLPVHGVSVAFKNSEGNPLCASQGRKIESFAEEQSGDNHAGQDNESEAPKTLSPTKAMEEGQPEVIIELDTPINGESEMPPVTADGDQDLEIEEESSARSILAKALASKSSSKVSISVRICSRSCLWSGLSPNVSKTYPPKASQIPSILGIFRS